MPAFVQRRLTLLFLACAGLMLSGAAHAVDLELGVMRKAIFKVRVISQESDYRQPWNQQPVRSSSGTGFYIGAAGILTNAHVVAQGKFISVLKDGDDKPVSARVRYIAHDCDLALLEVQDKNYFKDVKPLSLGDMPEVRDTVYTVGYPTGGEQLSITQGVVSRISYRRYVHTGADSHLLIQVDSAINHGNSGGPVLKGRQVIGVAFQTQTSAENTGYIIPTPVVERFLKDIADKKYDGHPPQGFWDAEGVLENAATRSFHGLKPGEGGVKISKIAASSPLKGYVEAGDVILAIDGQAIGSDGKVQMYAERLDFRVVYDLKQVGETVQLDLLRKGQRSTIRVPLRAQAPEYDSGKSYQLRPRFLVYAGLVFTVLQRDYLELWGRNWTVEAPLTLRYAHVFAPLIAAFQDRRDVIVLADRLPHAINTFAGSYTDEILLSVNGEEVRSLEDLASKLDSNQEDFLLFRFWERDIPLVLRQAAAKEADSHILKRYNIPSARWFGSKADDGATANWEEVKP
ncbi:MAG: PDZ domain-containing protein, partial [Oligoflexus sp.]